MYGSVRGAISDGRPYRDSYRTLLSQSNSLLCFLPLLHPRRQKILLRRDGGAGHLGDRRDVSSHVFRRSHRITSKHNSPKYKKPRRALSPSKFFLESYGGDDETRTRDLCRDSAALSYNRLISNSVGGHSLVPQGTECHFLSSPYCTQIKSACFSRSQDAQILWVLYYLTFNATQYSVGL